MNNLELSIEPYQFVFGLKSELTTQRLMHFIVDRISKDFRAIIHDEGYQLEIDRAFELLSELDEYGFTREAYSLLDEMAKVVSELFPHFIAYFNLHCSVSFPKYQPIKYIQQVSAFKGFDVVVEGYSVENGVLYFDFTKDDVEYSASVKIVDLVEYMKQDSFRMRIDEWMDKDGAHIQVESRIPVELLVDEFLVDGLKSYIKDGLPIAMI